MFKNEKSIIIVMVIIALIIFFAFMVKIVYEQRNIYSVSNSQLLDYKMYGFISNNSTDSIKMKKLYEKVGNKFIDKMNCEVIDVTNSTSISSKYKVHVTPSFIILDKYGNVVKRQNGVLEYDKLLEIISKVIQK